MKKIYNNEFEKAKMITQLLDAKTIQQYVNIPKETLSRFKKRDNAEWKTIKSITDIPIPEDLKGGLKKLMNCSPEELGSLVKDFSLKNSDWLSFLSIQMEIETDLFFLKKLASDLNLSGKVASNIKGFYGY